MEGYNKTRLIQNIAYLMKVNNVKVGELESRAKLSPGYLSRLKNNENEETCPGVDTLMLFSEILNCNIMTLLYCDLYNLTETERFIYSFLESLLKQTNDNTVDWEKITENTLKNTVCEGDVGELMHDGGMEPNRYVSLFTDDGCDVDGPVYKLERLTQKFYIVRVAHYIQPGGAILEYEMYLVKDGRRKTICNCDSNSKKPFTTIMPMLYDAAAKSSNVIRIDSDVKKGLEDFLSGDDDKLPF